MSSQLRFLSRITRTVFLLVAMVILSLAALVVFHTLPMGKTLHHVETLAHCCERTVQILATASIAILLFPATRFSLCGILVWVGLGVSIGSCLLINGALSHIAGSFGLLLIAISHLFWLKRELVRAVKIQSRMAIRRDSRTESRGK